MSDTDHENIRYMVTFLLLLFVGCVTEKDQTTEQQIKLVKVDSVVLEQEEPLFGKFYEQIKVTNDGQFWLFADRIRNQVFVFRNDGSFYSVLGQKGKGPKGIEQIAGFDVNEEGIVFILDSAQRLLKKFDLNGGLLSTTNYFEKTPFVPSSFNTLWYKGKIVSAIFETEYIANPQNSKLIAIMKMNGELDTLLGTHDPFTKQDNQFSVRNETVLSEMDNLLYVNLGSSPYYQIYKLDTGERVGYYGRMSSLFKLPEQEIDPYMPASQKVKKLAGTTAVRRMYLTDRYVIQHVQILTQEWFQTVDIDAKENYLIFYDRETNEFIQEMKVSYVPVGEHDNQLYMIEDFNPDNYTIGIYDLVTEN